MIHLEEIAQFLEDHPDFYPDIYPSGGTVRLSGIRAPEGTFCSLAEIESVLTAKPATDIVIVKN